MLNQRHHSSSVNDGGDGDYGSGVNSRRRRDYDAYDRRINGGRDGEAPPSTKWVPIVVALLVIALLGVGLFVVLDKTKRTKAHAPDPAAAPTDAAMLESIHVPSTQHTLDQLKRNSRGADHAAAPEQPPADHTASVPLYKLHKDDPVDDAPVLADPLKPVSRAAVGAAAGAHSAAASSAADPVPPARLHAPFVVPVVPPPLPSSQCRRWEAHSITTLRTALCRHNPADDDDTVTGGSRDGVLTDFSCFRHRATQAMNTLAAPLAQPQRWLPPHHPPAFDAPTDRLKWDTPAYFPFTRRFVLPNAAQSNAAGQPEPVVAVWGDLHGSACAFASTLQRWMRTHPQCFPTAVPSGTAGWVLAPHCTIVLLGDIVDRGPNAVEVMWIVFTLMHNNPPPPPGAAAAVPTTNGRVVWVRGNHEDISLATHYGLSDELHEKFGLDLPRAYALHQRRAQRRANGSGGDDDDSSDGAAGEDDGVDEDERGPRANNDALQLFGTLFGLLPAALYIGVPSATPGGPIEYLQYSHGSYEFGYNPRRFLSAASSGDVEYEYVSAIDRPRELEKLLDSSSSPATGALATKSDANADRWVRTAVRELMASSVMLRRHLTVAPFVSQTPAHPDGFGVMWHDFLLTQFDYYDARSRETGINPVAAAVGGATPHARALMVFNSGRGFGWSQELLIRLMNLPVSMDSTSYPGSSSNAAPATGGGVRLRGIVRAHQHNNAQETGPMLRHLQARHGLVNMHGHTHGVGHSSAPLWVPRPGYVFLTLLSAAEASLGLRDDSFAVWSFGSGGSGHEWTLQHHWRPHAFDLPSKAGANGDDDSREWTVETHRFPALMV